MRKTLPVLVGLAAALMASATAEAALTGLKFTAKVSATNPRLFICNLYVTFSAPGDNLIAVVGLPAPGAPLSYSTNSVLGFHQEFLPAFIGPSDVPLPVATTGAFPNYLDDTYITIGVKTGFAPGAAPSFASVGILPGDAPPGSADWNVVGSPLTTALIPGGSYFVLPGAPEAVEVGGQVLIAQLVIDGNAGTTDGLAARIDAFIPEITWADAAGTATSTTGLFASVHPIPVPGTLALLGLAGLAGIRRRRR